MFFCPTFEVFLSFPGCGYDNFEIYQTHRIHGTCIFSYIDHKNHPFT